MERRATKLVVISGCDTGFGRELAILLSTKCGYVVLAGCLNKDSQSSLQKICGDNLYTATLDVTKDESVEAFMKTMTDILDSKSGSNKITLHALVNNAGILNLGAIDWMKMDQFRLDMEVNYFGVIRLTKACLPFMKDLAIANRGTSEAAPRIINVTSVAGLMPCPFMGSYCATKHAAEAFTASLRMELKAWGIPVVTLNPSTHRTPLVGGLVATMMKCWKDTDESMKDMYGEAWLGVAIKTVDHMDRATWDPMNVVRRMENGVSLYNPQSQYLVGLDALCIIPIMTMIPSWLMEHPTAFLPAPVALRS
jgi:NAD(P)-dependent dehydrogenase (short-subunit alcohol dehydrogenase family)